MPLKVKCLDTKTDIKLINIYSCMYKDQVNMQYTGHIPAIFNWHNTNTVAYCDKIVLVLKIYRGIYLWLIEVRD